MVARLACCALILSMANVLFGGAYRTQNFIVQTHSSDFAKQVGEFAERYRRELAIEWLGHELPPWQQPCPITVQAGEHLGAGGATSFMFERGRPFGWKMNIQGSQQRILDSVLPHEVTHTIFATHFGGPLPRWADEGGCTIVEHPEEREKQKRFLYEFLTTGRGIPFNVMFRLKEYPSDIMPLYAQGHSVVSYLISQGGKRKFVDFVGAGMASNDWNSAIQQFYGFQHLSDLQMQWNDWVASGSPLPDANEQYVQAEPANRSPRLDQAQLASLSQRDARQGPPVTLASGRSESIVPNHQASSGSWYADQRDAARGQRGDIRLASNHAAVFQPGSTRGTFPPAATSAAQPSSAPMVTRPQAMQQVAETVLDPGTSPAGPRMSPAPMTQGPITRAPFTQSMVPQMGVPFGSMGGGG